MVESAVNAVWQRDTADDAHRRRRADRGRRGAGQENRLTDEEGKVEQGPPGGQAQAGQGPVVVGLIEPRGACAWTLERTPRSTPHGPRPTVHAPRSTLHAFPPFVVPPLVRAYHLIRSVLCRVDADSGPSETECSHGS